MLRNKKVLVSFVLVSAVTNASSLSLVDIVSNYQSYARHDTVDNIKKMNVSKLIHTKLLTVQRCVVLLPEKRSVEPRCFILVSNSVQTNQRLCSSHSHHSASSIKRIDVAQPFAYYEILGIKRDAKQSEVKAAYFKMAKIYHPDVNTEDDARETFDKITEAYTTLIDLTQRYFYDQHGVASEQLKKDGSNSTIFDWVPKYSIYENQTRADGETTEVEDWFKAQGHQGFDYKRISLRQFLKNAYVEFKYGISYYNFPWQWQSFTGWFIVWVVFMYVLIESLNYGYRATNHLYRNPVPIYLKWENDDIYDILWYVGARKNKSDKTRDGMSFPTNSKGKKETNSKFI